jgi:hypothetical protein
VEDSSFSRLVGVLTHPTRTFAAIAARPTVAVVLLTLLLFGTGVLMLAIQKVDLGEMVRQQIADSGRELTAEQTDQAVEFYERFGWLTFLLAGLVFGPLAYLLVAAVFLVVLRLVGGEISYKTSLSVFLHGMMPSAVAAVVAVPVVLARSEITAEQLQGGNLLASHLGALLGPDPSKPLFALLSSLDVFSFWAIGLLIIGYAAAAKVSRGSAAGVVIGLWLVYVVGKVAITAIAS